MGERYEKNGAKVLQHYSQGCTSIAYRYVFRAQMLFD